MKVFYRCLRMSWKSCMITFVMVLVLLWSGLLYLDTSRKVESQWYLKPAPCKTPASQIHDMVELTFLLHNILDKLHVPHVLCFGTLWGALRNNEILPWDNNVDICAHSKDFSHATSSDMIDSLKDHGAVAVYNSRYGYFEIKYKQALGYINLLAEQISFGDSPMMYQIGWGRWSLFSKVKEFLIPSRFMESPFKTTNFYGKQIPVPHEDIEILKYLYPNDWWLEIKPPGC
ncbi:uncharacterized protein LOC126810586 [Patella vulgata]|uniref:uncharacterized protein LOC126810586 n=1 Tax=Patella vulgata TaxID=6465 RepID=UPI0024A95C67|nr:uncharacterized protein LOC126810586 [Patella vulgata]